jgi:hypothetical protein
MAAISCRYEKAGKRAAGAASPPPAASVPHEWRRVGEAINPGEPDFPHLFLKTRTRFAAKLPSLLLPELYLRNTFN